MSNMFRKDFYIYLPVYLQNELDAKMNEFSNEEWFAAAWDQYRTHVLSTPKMHMQTPNLFFSQFIKEEPAAEVQEEVVEEPVEVTEEPELETIEIVSEEPKEPVIGFGEMLSGEAQEPVTEEQNLPSDEEFEELPEIQEEKEEMEINDEEFIEETNGEDQEDIQED